MKNMMENSSTAVSYLNSFPFGPFIFILCLGRPIKIEIIVDSEDAAGSTRSTPASTVPSLLGRIGKVVAAPKRDSLAPQSQVLNTNLSPA